MLKQLKYVITCFALVAAFSLPMNVSAESTALSRYGLGRSFSVNRTVSSGEYRKLTFYATQYGSSSAVYPNYGYYRVSASDVADGGYFKITYDLKQTGRQIRLTSFWCADDISASTYWTSPSSTTSNSTKTTTLTYADYVDKFECYTGTFPESNVCYDQYDQLSGSGSYVIDIGSAAKTEGYYFIFVFCNDGASSISVSLENPDPEPTPEPTPDPTPEPTPEPTPDPTPEPTPDPTPEPTPDPTPEPTPDPTPLPPIDYSDGIGSASSELGYFSTDNGTHNVVFYAFQRLYNTLLGIVTDDSVPDSYASDITVPENGFHIGLVILLSVELCMAALTVENLNSFPFAATAVFALLVETNIP